jgi:hypothetical protein
MLLYVLYVNNLLGAIDLYKKIEYVRIEYLMKMTNMDTKTKVVVAKLVFLKQICELCTLIDD